MNVHHGNQCWEIGISLPKDEYVSNSVYNQIHMHILLYYVCHALQFTEIAFNRGCQVQDVER